MLSIDAPISVGELFDKLTIIGIKRLKITDHKKLTNIEDELAALSPLADMVYEEVKRSSGFEALTNLVSELNHINMTLWDIEDEIREHEMNQDFGHSFIELARGVYQNNDKRSRLKKLINEQTGSRIFEEKSYTEY